MRNTNSPLLHWKCIIGTLKNRILPGFGNRHIDKITTIQIVTFLKELQHQAPEKTGKKVRSILKPCDTFIVH
ncbi:MULTISPECIES: N-terminal phage integrase SAM-like domain-containing protein [Shouchella]|uniref:N-terminal phage integrase SAM-like domain-containing protein n=1 Tax=Shouchella rhizosphaerae TaxID=866786 RepID=A0ABZ2CZ27_9BACI|nr:N-terminal phage integrase SAM-like domain-containing protein [Shouchella clausii]